MEKVTCSKLSTKLTEIKDLKREFDLALENVISTRKTVQALLLKKNIENIFDDIREKFFVFRKVSHFWPDDDDFTNFIKDKKERLCERDILLVIMKIMKKLKINSHDFEYVHLQRNKNGDVLALNVAKYPIRENTEQILSADVSFVFNQGDEKGEYSNICYWNKENDHEEREKAMVALFNDNKWEILV